MGFVSFVGRVLFASVFLLSAYQEFSEFGTDGGPAAKSLKPKFNLFVKQVSAGIGMAVPHIDIKSVIAFTMFLKAFGGLLFIISSSFGALVLLVYLAFITPVVYDFYNYDMESQQFAKLFTMFSSEPGPIRRAALLPGDEELHPKEALQEKGRKGQDNLKPANQAKGSW
ncbi:unnamed protein product [Triticum turgidum subsp. durum]|uniref:Reticulon-like protein n=1 Tax=Triticum turgidum subsp. durum TaxID=4567 RepID=A0A9R1RG96_TRITD|nr:unnamed protein product [Triticum turgidum subsp. durum]